MLKINENVSKEIAEKLIEFLKDPKSNLEELQAYLINLDNKQGLDVVLELPVSHKGFGLAFVKQESGELFMIGGLVYDSRDNSWGIHT